MLQFAAAVGIKGDIIEAAAGAEGHLLPAGGSAQAATWRVCHTRVLSLAWRRRGAAQEQPWAHASAWPAGGVRVRPMWLICLAGGSLRAHVRLLCQLRYDNP